MALLQMEFKSGQNVFAIVVDDGLPELIGAKVIDRDRSPTGPSYAVVRHGSSLRYIVEPDDVAGCAFDLESRFMEHVKAAKEMMLEKLAALDVIIDEGDG